MSSKSIYLPREVAPANRRETSRGRNARSGCFDVVVGLTQSTFSAPLRVLILSHVIPGTSGQRISLFFPEKKKNPRDVLSVLGREPRPRVQRKGWLQTSRQHDV